MTLFLLLVLGIELSLGPLDPLLTAEGSRLGSLIVLGALILLLLGFFVSLLPLVRGVRAGYSITANPINLLIAVMILLFILAFVGGVVIDQFPCWIGVPNCD